MTKEEKRLLLKDLYARLPYGFTVHRYSDNRDIVFGKDELDEFSHFLEYSEGEEFKPYLRSMSSMTEEEKKYISDKCGFSISGPIRNECELIMPVLAADWLIDFYNEHHFDYRGLIPMGLALEAKEGMYKTH